MKVSPWALKHLTALVVVLLSFVLLFVLPRDEAARTIALSVPALLAGLAFVSVWMAWIPKALGVSLFGLASWVLPPLTWLAYLALLISGR